ncbi:2-phosphosulfolactate phosphatase [Alkalibacillus aidingensis]|uniref:2-phosphosulfolactate phosphatase n=1 Tax=Alkalibacillus aidingensis TaxID=2747607 RepID=UPI0016615740|nr:2-phosphosulfolactate phosphatase [Alkalibacillus aidingensis]
MRKIYVVTQKELVNSDRLQGATAIVIDVFLATSTITFLLEKNYQPVYAAENQEHAMNIANQLGSDTPLMLGEKNGESINGFGFPDPRLLKHSEQQNAAIICSTNGTRAIEAAKRAKKLYISSITNGHLVAKSVDQESINHSPIVLVCSGNGGHFSLEDFVGAGHIIDHLLKSGEFELNDAAKLARNTFINVRSNNFIDLYSCDTKHLLERLGYPGSVDYVINQFEKVNVIPVYQEGKIMNISSEVTQS